MMTTLETLLTDSDNAGEWTLDPDRSSITFKIRNMWGLVNVKGKFTEFSADGRLAENVSVAGRLEVQVASLDTGIGRRDKHLLSADFFDVERFPQISVVITALRPTGARGADLRASFTIKGRTEPVPLPVTITELDDGSVQISGETEIERSQFDVGTSMLGMIGGAARVTADVNFVRATQ
jgi:polyisoprenoid-binding protein YceI